MTRLPHIALFLLPLLACAQEKPAPPPELDKALRERAGQFIQYTIDKNYKRAYELVAEDTKDWYLSSGKPQYNSFHIEEIEYSKDFQEATVKSKVTRELTMNSQVRTAEVTVSDLWKMEDGKWMWFHDPNVLVTPFGEIKIDRSKMPAGGPSAPIPSDVSPEAAAAAAGKLNVTASVNKREVSFARGTAANDDLVFHNGLQGVVIVVADIVGDYKSFSVEPKRVQLESGKEATFKVHYQPAEKFSASTVRLTLEPFGRELHVPIRLSGAAEAPH
ncbi:MAG TPA: hypothetical protein VGR73_20170 [Bryobacteraceae bacterium]|nr:hypothetical protein [Bryobacteraceae bacterium]